jgi:membrane-bound ClpP family serine protease
MISPSLEDIVFGSCALVGLVLAALAVVFGDRLRDLVDQVNPDLEGAAPMVAALLMGFLLLFGAGGLVAVRLVGVHGAFAVLAGMAAGGVGAVLGWTLVTSRRGADALGRPSMRDLVGGVATVAVAIPAGRFGSVYVRSKGQTHEYSATAMADIPVGVRVSITGGVGDGVVVARIESPIAARVLSDDGDPGS